MIRPLQLVYTFVIAFAIPTMTACADSIFTIGNSLTWDAKPHDLDGEVDYHIYCSKNLQYIYDNPNGHCIPDSLTWTTALSTKQYDWVSVQPHEGTTLQQDIDIISGWMSMQPNATFVIHPAWTWFVNFPSDYTAGNPDDQMRPSPEYISDLMAGLQSRHAGRELRSTHSNDLLYSIYLDTQNDIGPFDSLADLSRDWVHMGLNTGRYLAHNALRLSMDQPISSAGFSMDPAIESYFNSKLTALAIPEPSMFATCMLFTGLAAFRCKRTRR